MAKREKLFLGVFFALLLFSGCIIIDYEAEQEFNEDGTSAFTADEYIGFSSSISEMYESEGLLGGSTEPSTIAARLLLDFYSTKNYPEALCDLMDDVECSGEDDGYLHVETSLEPDEFYEFKKEIDWLNLKEVLTYKIEKVPMARYFAYEDEGLAEEALTEGAMEYARENVGKYITENYYCVDAYYSDVLCEISSMSGGKATVKVIGDSYNPVKVKWIGCTDESYGTFLFMSNVSEARDVFESVKEVDTTLTQDESTTATVDCPTNAQTIVVFYETSSYYSGTDEDIGIFEIVTKAEMEQQVEDELDSSLYDSYDYGTTSGLPQDDLTLNFKRGEVMGMTFEELSEAISGASAYYSSMYGFDVNVKYKATFPDRVASATIDDEDIKATGNSVQFELDDLADLPEGYLVVTVERDLFPLGALTWVILAVVILGAVYFLVFRK